VTIGWIGSDSGSDQAGRVNLACWKKSDRVNLYVVFFQIFDRFQFD
jgi:hypothetical protein